MAQLPQELVIEIFALLSDDLSTLCSAARVNRVWADAASEFIWKHPPFSALASIPSEIRRQRLSRYVERLDLCIEDKVYLGSSWKPNLPRLRTFSVSVPNTASYNDSDVWFHQLLQPSITSFHSEHLTSEQGNELLDLVELNCPHLRYLSIDHDMDTEITLDRFIKFLDSFSSLRSIALGQPVRRDDEFAYLMTRKGLEYLELGSEPYLDDEEAVFQSILHSSQGPSSLVIKEVDSNNELAPSLISKLTALTELKIHFINPDFESVCSLSELTNLVSLTIGIRAETDWGMSPEELDALAQLTQLRRFEIVVEEFSFLYFETPWLNDHYFSSWIQKLANLETLTLRMWCELSGLALVSLGKACRRIRQVDLTGNFDITHCQKWQEENDQSILFPELRILGDNGDHEGLSRFRICSHADQENEEAIFGSPMEDDENYSEAEYDAAEYDPHEIARIVRQVAPRLEKLYSDPVVDRFDASELTGRLKHELEHHAEYSKRVMQAFEESKG